MQTAARSLFTGAYELKVDAKGRIAMPAELRREIDTDAFNGFIATPSLTDDTLECGGLQHLQSIRDMIESEYDPYSLEGMALRRALLGQSRRIPFDSDGRFSLPAPLREHAGIEDSVLLTGLGATFEIRRGAGAVAIDAETRGIARAALQRLKHPRLRDPKDGSQ